MDIITHLIEENQWKIPTRYSRLEQLGAGSYGFVCSAYDSILKRNVAIKKLSNPFATSIHAKRAYRELKLLNHIKHYNIISLLNVFMNSNSVETLNEFYLVTNLTGSNLSDILASREDKGIELNNIIFWTYQILRGLKYLHSANIIHRDLKPSNITINEDQELRIIDFGLARNENDEMTGYVVTRWYRAPEITLQPKKYTKAVDLWSLGCILAEMFLNNAIFPGKSYLDQILIILDVVGYPSENYLKKLDKENLFLFQNKKGKSKVDFSEHFSEIYKKSKIAIDLLEKLLELDPNERITCEDALKHEFLKEWHDDLDEPNCELFVDIYDEINQEYTVKDWKNKIFEHVLNFTEPDEKTLAIIYEDKHD